ncbi:MAG: hypothetical protein IKZ19_04780, partial [Clostridia bacterium]|nr:hypothetical protein [Clostridia bacterium]
MNFTLYILKTENLDINEPRFQKAMSSHRAEKIERLRKPEEKKLSMGAELCLCAASKKLGLPIPPQYKNGETGKPQFPVSPPYFNLSHCSGCAVCAIADCEIGVDAETKDRSVSEGVLKRLLAPGESCPSPIEKWVEKESFVKLTGKGLAQGLGSFSTDGRKASDLSGKTLAHL